MTALETVTAWPVGANSNKAAQRTAITKRFIWVFSDTEDTRNFDVVDPADGTLPLYIQWKGILFKYDATDTTTAHDGETCAVTNDNKRYKSVAAIPAPYSVLSTTTSAQPTSPAPSQDDAYYIPSAATGTDWAGKDGMIGIYTARGWAFQAIRIGQFVYDESTDTYYHKTAAGTLTAGFGSQALGAGSVLPSNMSGGGGKVRWYIENQTTNTPPTSPTPTDGVEYIVGSSPTGAWAGKSGQIARYESGAWVFYPPSAGWTAYDKSLGYDYKYNGTSWISSLGAWIGLKTVRDRGSFTGSITGGSNYTYSATTAPTKSHDRLVETLTIAYQAKRAGATLRIRYQALISVVNSTAKWAPTVALFNDLLSSAIDYERVGVNANGDNVAFSIDFLITASDDSERTYSFAIMRKDSNNSVTGLANRRITIEEAA